MLHLFFCVEHNKYRLFRRSEELQEIAQDTHSSHCRAGAGALYDQRPRAVPLGMEHDDIVRSAQRCRECMRLGVSVIVN